MIYLSMSLGSDYGWGLCGKHLALELSLLEPLRLVGEPIHINGVGDALEFHCLQGLFLGGEEEEACARPDGSLVVRGPLLQGIGNKRLLPRRPGVRGSTNIGYTFFEHNLLRPEWIDNGRRCFDGVATGSTWCTRVLSEAGLERVSTVTQGLDARLFHPCCDGKCKRLLMDKFVVFSGGKFELRKGQDIVIRAYKVLQDRHADVMLVNAWHNPWPAEFETMSQSKLIRFPRAKGPQVQLVNRILADSGIDLERVVCCPQQSNLAMPLIYWNTDVGLFPNRCEGGTNLVLMEYMACGKPVVAVDTTGHADIVNASNALVIGTKGETTVRDAEGVPVAVWPEPDLDDAIDKLEWAYQNRDKMREFGDRAAKDLQQLTWRKTAEGLQKIILEASDHH